MGEKFRYYVVYSYVLPNGGGLRMGGTEHDAEGPMEDSEVRHDAAQKIAGLGFTHVVIINWKRIH